MTKAHLVKVNINGQVSIPAPLRKRLGLQPGDYVEADLQDPRRIVLTPVRVTTGKKPAKDPLREAAQFGIDLTLLEANLQKSPTERLKVHSEFNHFANDLREAGSRRS